METVTVQDIQNDILNTDRKKCFANFIEITKILQKKIWDLKIEIKVFLFNEGDMYS